jgi:hypothetical protein
MLIGPTWNHRNMSIWYAPAQNHFQKIPTHLSLFVDAPVRGSRTVSMRLSQLFFKVFFHPFRWLGFQPGFPISLLDYGEFESTCLFPKRKIGGSKRDNQSYVSVNYRSCGFNDARKRDCFLFAWKYFTRWGHKIEANPRSDSIVPSIFKVLEKRLHAHILKGENPIVGDYESSSEHIIRVERGFQ